jgi:hypothetical protein
MCLIFDKETDGLSAFLYLAVEPLELSIGSLFHLDGGYSLRLLHSVVFFLGRDWAAQMDLFPVDVKAVPAVHPRPHAPRLLSFAATFRPCDSCPTLIYVRILWWAV